MVTIREVAKAAGVSVATASRALNGLSIVTPDTCRVLLPTCLVSRRGRSFVERLYHLDPPAQECVGHEPQRRHIDF